MRRLTKEYEQSIRAVERKPQSARGTRCDRESVRIGEPPDGGQRRLRIHVLLSRLLRGAARQCAVDDAVGPCSLEGVSTKLKKLARVTAAVEMQQTKGIHCERVEGVLGNVALY